MPQRTHWPAVRRTRPAVEVVLQRHRARLIRKEPERLDSGSVESDDRRPHRCRQVQQPGIATDEALGALEQCRAPVEREKARGARRRATGGVGDGGCRTLLRFPAQYHDVVGRRELVRQCHPMLFWPPLREMCRPGGERDQRTIVSESVLRQEGVRRGVRVLAGEELWGLAVRRDVEVAGGGEVPFRDVSEGTAMLAASRNQQPATQAMLGIARPRPAHEATQRLRPQRPVQIQSIGPMLCAQGARQCCQRRAAMPGDEFADAWVAPQRVGHVRADDEGDPAVGMTGTDRAQQRRGEEEIADRGEADDQDVPRHAGN